MGDGEREWEREFERECAVGEVGRRSYFADILCDSVGRTVKFQVTVLGGLVSLVARQGLRLRWPAEFETGLPTRAHCILLYVTMCPTRSY